MYKYLVYSYLYRDKVFDEILDDCSIFVSQMLRKITAYKTFIFIKYYKEVMDADMKQKLNDALQLVKNFYQSDKVADDAQKA